MQLPVDPTTLTAWATLLGLTDAQTSATVAAIEDSLRLGYNNRPDELRDHTFAELAADMDTDEAALLFLIHGLRQAGYPEAAHSVEIRGLFTTLHTLQQAS